MYKNQQQKPTNNMVMLSKKLSWLLRHGAIKEGLHIKEDGFIELEEILKHPNYNKFYSLKLLQELVDNDEKKRYTIRKNPQSGVYEIRANQGHTLKEVQDDECLTPILAADEVPLAVHGTYYRYWETIKKQGLKRMSRNHVHFATTDTGTKGTSGFRHDCQLLIYLNVKQVLEDGHLKLYRSDNNVILCSGLEDGTIPLNYFAKVKDRRTGQLLDLKNVS